MSNPLDKRRDRRMPIELYLTISDLFCQDNVKANISEADIEVVNISKQGIGFISQSTLPLNYYFNAKLVLGKPDNIIYSVIKIIRVQKKSNGFTYGCEFVGLPDILYPAFEQYEQLLDN